jgi:hypothetical protein
VQGGAQISRPANNETILVRWVGQSEGKKESLIDIGTHSLLQRVPICLCDLYSPFGIVFQTGSAEINFFFFVILDYFDILIFFK